MLTQTMELIPAIDVLGDEAVRLERGDYGRATGYGSPLAVAARFASWGAARLHVVDLDGARTGRVRPELVRSMSRAASPTPVQASGGVRRIEDAQALLEAGATRVVVGTAAWRLLNELVDALGERLVVALDARAGAVRTRGWLDAALPLDEAIRRCVESGVPRLLCTAIDRDGTLGGPDLGLVSRVVGVSGLPVVAAGGIRGDADVAALAHVGAEGAIVGRAALEGRVTPRAPRSGARSRARAARGRAAS